jgi:diguanylate cyclase (GGDEF)-like protein
MDAEGAALESLTLLKRLRAADVPYHLPVFLILSSADTAERLLALRLGADDVLSTPWDPEELVARVERSVGFKRRVDSLIAQGRKLEQLSVTDGLTQVYNHRFFRERLNAEFRRSQRYDDGLALLFVDLDHFKDVNDLYGHLAGDEVLHAAAQAVRACLRDVDIAARYGGEEFAVLLPRTDLDGAMTVAERIRRDIQKLRLQGQPQLRVTASVGVAALPSPHVSSADQLVGAADAALYRAKRAGRNRALASTALYEPTRKARNSSR